jgi:hypothetical protein
MRPTSAKATKHKRVADNNEKPTVYEDCEDSEPEEHSYGQKSAIELGCEGHATAFEPEASCNEGEIESSMHGLAPGISNSPQTRRSGPAQMFSPPPCKPIVEVWCRTSSSPRMASKSGEQPQAALSHLGSPDVAIEDAGTAAPIDCFHEASSRLGSTGAELDKGAGAELKSGDRGSSPAEPPVMLWPNHNVPSTDFSQLPVADCMAQMASEPRASSPPPRPRYLS